MIVHDVAEVWLRWNLKSFLMCKSHICRLSQGLAVPPSPLKNKQPSWDLLQLSRFFSTWLRAAQSGIIEESFSRSFMQQTTTTAATVSAFMFELRSNIDGFSRLSDVCLVSCWLFKSQMNAHSEFWTGLQCVQERVSLSQFGSLWPSLCLISAARESPETPRMKTPNVGKGVDLMWMTSPRSRYRGCEHVYFCCKVWCFHKEVHDDWLSFGDNLL